MRLCHRVFNHPAALLEPDAILRVVARHIRKDYRVAFSQTVEHLNAVDRSASYLDWNAHCTLVFRIFLEQTQGGVLVAKSGAANIKHVREPFQIDRSVYA